MTSSRSRTGSWSLLCVSLWLVGCHMANSDDTMTDGGALAADAASDGGLTDDAPGGGWLPAFDSGPVEPDALPGCADSRAEDVSGIYVLAVAPLGDPETPLLFEARAVAAIDDTSCEGTLELTLWPLTVADPSRRATLPDGAEATIGPKRGPIAADGSFDIDFGRQFVPGSANSLSGSHIEATLRLVGRTQADDQFCGELAGQVHVPFEVGLDGSTFAVVKVSDDPDAAFDRAALGEAAADAPTSCPESSPSACPGFGARDVSGIYVLAVAPLGDSVTPLLFETRAVATADDATCEGTLELTLWPLTVGDPSQRATKPDGAEAIIGPAEGPLAADGTFDIDLGRQFVPGSANSLSGSDIEATLRLVGTTKSERLFCGELVGQIHVPFEVGLEGSTFAAARVSDDPDAAVDRAAVGAAADEAPTRCP